MNLKNQKYRLQGLRNKHRGAEVEKYFTNSCRAEKICYFRISDGGRPAPNSPRGWIRHAQVCDFIISINSNFWLLDIKSTKKLPTYSFFFPPEGEKVKISTHRQTDSFIRAFEFDNNNRCGFLFHLTGSDHDWNFISGETLFKLRVKETKELTFQNLKKIKDLENPSPQKTTASPLDFNYNF